MANFLSKEQEQAVILAIREAEAQTSGEIRVHLQQQLDGPVLDVAQRAFFRLDMHHTRQRNGVLFFIVPEKRQFAVVGDQGIDACVPLDFWDDIRDLLREHFQKGAFSEGLCAAIVRVGEKLKTFFPASDDNPNELSDELSFGDAP
jgi:uncharacterized membrane protein